MNWIRKIGIIDIIIIIFVAVFFGFVGNYFLAKLGFRNNMEQIVYKLEITGAESQLVDQLKEGKDVFNRSKNYYMGEITNVEIRPHKEEHKDLEQGIMSLVNHPEKSNIVLDIRVEARIVNDVVSLEEDELRIGLETDIQGKSFDCISTIISIERGKDGEKVKLGRLWNYIYHNYNNYSFRPKISQYEKMESFS